MSLSRNNQFDFNTTRSFGLSRIYSHNHALTFFTKNDIWGNIAFAGLRVEECIVNFRFGYREDSNHDSWHKNANDFDENHIHIIKNDFTKISPEHFTCILDNFVSYQKGMPVKFKAMNQTAIDNGEACLPMDNINFLSQKDYREILYQYHQYYYGNLMPLEKKQLEITINNRLSTVVTHLKSTIDFNEANYSALHAFIMTLFKYYLRPYLIEKQYFNQERTNALLSTAESSLNLLFTASIPKIIFGTLINNALPPILKSIGINGNNLTSLIETMSTVAIITNHPFIFLQLAANGACATFGSHAAHQLIAKLPKLRIEPLQVNNIKTSIVKKNDRQTLRHRNNIMP